VPDGRLLLAVEGQSTRLVDARTGEPAGGPWEIDSDVYATVVVPLADGRLVSASAHGDGLALHDAWSGAALPPPHDFTLWKSGSGWKSVAFRRPGAAGCLGAGAGRDSRRPVLLSLGRLGESQAPAGLESLVQTVQDLPTVPARRKPTGLETFQECPGSADVGVDGLAAEPALGPPVPVGTWPAFTAIHVDRAGVPFGFVYVGDVDEDDPDGKHVERWRLDSATRVGPPLPATFCTVFDDEGMTWMVLSEPDGSLVVCPLPPVEAEPAANPDAN